MNVAALAYVPVYTQKVVGDTNLDPVSAQSGLATGTISANAQAVLDAMPGGAKTFVGAYVCKADDTWYAVYSVEVDATDNSTRYVATTPDQAGMIALDAEDKLVVRYTEVPGSGNVSFVYYQNGEAIEPSANNFPLSPANNLTDGKYDTDVDLKIWLPRRIGYDYITVTSVTAKDSQDNAITVGGGSDNLFTISKENLPASGDIVVQVNMARNLETYHVTFSGANSIWNMSSDHSYQRGDGSTQTYVSCDRSEAERIFTYQANDSSTISFTMQAFLQWAGNSWNGKKLNKISVSFNGGGEETLILPSPTTGSSASTVIAGGQYVATVTCTQEGDTRGNQYAVGDPSYYVAITAQNGAAAHGDCSISTNYKDVDDAYEIWALELYGIQNSTITNGQISNDGGSFNPWDNEFYLTPNGKGFWNRNNNAPTTIYATIAEGFPKEVGPANDPNYYVALNINGTEYHLPNDGSAVVGCSYSISGTQIVINLPANFYVDGKVADDVRIIIKALKKNVRVKYDLTGGAWADSQNHDQDVKLTLDGYGFNLASDVPVREGYVFTGWKLDNTGESYRASAVYTTNESQLSNRPREGDSYVYTFHAQWVEKDQEYTAPYAIHVRALDKNGNEVTLPLSSWTESGIFNKTIRISESRVLTKVGLTGGDYIAHSGNQMTMVLNDKSDTFELLYLEKINPQVTVTKDATVTTAKRGDTVTYTIKVQNTGDVAINPANTPNGIVVTDPLPGAVVKSGNGYEVVDGAAKITSLAVDAEVNITVEYQIPSGIKAGELTNTATASGTYRDTRESDGTEYSLSSSDDATVEVQKELKIDPLADVTYNGTDQEPGQEAKLTVRDLDTDTVLTLGVDFEIASHTGETTDVTADGVTIKVVGKEGTPYAGKEATITYKINPKPITVTANSAEKLYDGNALTDGGYTVTDADGKPAGFEERDGADISVTGSQTLVGSSSNVPAVTFSEGKASNYDVTLIDGTLTVTDQDGDGNHPDDELVVSKTDGAANDGKKYEVGEQVEFTIEVKNIYDRAMHITLEELAGVSLDKAYFENVAAGATITATATYTITQADVTAGSFVNTVKAFFTDPNPDPQNPVNPDPYEAEDEVDVEELDTTLEVQKTVTSQGEIIVGDIITYTITVTNKGNVDYTNVVVTDQLSGAKIASVETKSGYTIDKIKETVTIATLAVGESAVIKVEYVATKADGKAGKVENIASAAADPIPDPDEPGEDRTPGDDSNKVIVPVTDVFDLTVIKAWRGDSSATRPKTVTIQLTKDNVEVMKVVLSDSNQWTYSFLNLPDNGKYKIAEENVPNGYSVSYSEKGGVVTVTNAKIHTPGGDKPLQTGQLNWPIPVLSFLGVAMCTGGAVLTLGKKKKDEE